MDDRKKLNYITDKIQEAINILYDIRIQVNQGHERWRMYDEDAELHSLISEIDELSDDAISRLNDALASDV